MGGSQSTGWNLEWTWGEHASATHKVKTLLWGDTANHNYLHLVKSASDEKSLINLDFYWSLSWWKQRFSSWTSTAAVNPIILFCFNGAEFPGATLIHTLRETQHAASQGELEFSGAPETYWPIFGLQQGMYHYHIFCKHLNLNRQINTTILNCCVNVWSHNWKKYY